MKKAKSCCFILGSFSQIFEGKEENVLTNEIKEKITQQIDYLIEKENISFFYTGMESGADLFYADYVLSKKEEFGLKLCCVIPYEEQALNFSEEERDLYFSVAQRSDEEIMLNHQKVLGCRRKRDEFMIKNSDVIILLHDTCVSPDSLNLQKIDKEKQIIVINPFNSRQNATFKRIV